MAERPEAKKRRLSEVPCIVQGAVRQVVPPERPHGRTSVCLRVQNVLRGPDVEPGDVIWFAATTWREQMPPGDYMIELERLGDAGLVEVYLEGAPLVGGDERHGSDPAAAELDWAPEVRPIDELSDEPQYPTSS